MSQSLDLTAQCANPPMPSLSWTPTIPGPNDQITFHVSREYADGCTGLAAKGLPHVDNDNKIITLYFDQYCFDTTCTQAVHCDTANYTVAGLDIGNYTILVKDTSDANHLCDSTEHMGTLDSSSVEIQLVSLEGSTHHAKTGSRQCVPYTISGFKNANTLQAVLEWDTLQLAYDTIRNIYPVSWLDPASFNPARKGQLRVIWIDFDVDGETVPDGAVLFEVCFDVIGSAPDTAIIEFAENILPTEIEDIDGEKLPISTSNGAVIISDDRYPDCEVDTADILCQEWVKDSVIKAKAQFCNDSSFFEVALVEWRGWQLLKMSTGMIDPSDQRFGSAYYYSCEGELIGRCNIGGFGNGICDNRLLEQDVNMVKHVWQCGETLPGCYTTSAKDVRSATGIIVNTLSSGSIQIKEAFVGKDYQVLDAHGRVVNSGILDATLNTGNLNMGVYWIRSADQLDKFIRIQ
jgi:hypothetical protein